MQQQQRRGTVGMIGHDPNCPACLGRHRAHTYAQALYCYLTRCYCCALLKYSLSS